MRSHTGSIFAVLLLFFTGSLFPSPAQAETNNGVTCGLFDGIDEPGAIHWPVNGNLYYCGDTPQPDAAGVSVVWNAAQGSTDQMVGKQVVPFLKQVFTNTDVEVYVFGTIADFNKYFDTNITPPPGTDAAGLTTKPGQLPHHAGPVTAIFQHAPSINTSPSRLLILAQTTNHEMGHEMARYYKYPSTGSANYLNAVKLDIAYLNQQTCLGVFAGSGLTTAQLQHVCSLNMANWKRMQYLWPYDTSADEFFANVFAATSPGGSVNESLGVIINNHFMYTISYEHGLRTGTGKP
jgi:hypothetical protein